MIGTAREKEASGGEVVAENVVGLPATEEREARSQLHFHFVRTSTHHRGGDVPDVVPVIDVTSRIRQNGLYNTRRNLR